MKILKLVFVIVGIALIILGLYNAFVPQQALSIGSLEVASKEGLTNQTIGMIGLGVLALLAAIFAKKRR